MYNTACDGEIVARPLRNDCRRSFTFTKIRLNNVHLTIIMKASCDHTAIMLSLKKILLNLREINTCNKVQHTL